MPVQQTYDSVAVHPLVLLSVVDHASRITKGAKKRVVGVLLGEETSKPSGSSELNVTNSFAVPFEEDDRDHKTWFMDHDFIENMNEMFKKISVREKIVGWYHTGPKLRSNDLDINDVLNRFCSKPVMIIVDPQRQAGIPTDAYMAVQEIKEDGTSASKTFHHIPSSITASEPEEIGVEHLLRDIKDLSTATLSTRMSDLLSSLRGLSSRLYEIREYLNDVESGKLPVNHQVIYHLQDVFNLLPALQGPKGKARTTTTNDGLLVTYLSSLIRAVVALHDLVNNKLEIVAAERGDTKADGTEEKKKDSDKKEGADKKETASK